jgi:membrane protein DedA with SNARE-associated domain
MSFLQALPHGQLALAASIFAGTFVYEDAATVLAATLSATGRLDPVLGLVAAFVGIWVGDIWVYAMGSTFRKYAVRWRRFQRFLKAESLEKAQAWFASHGSWTLVVSRTIPGSRLPLYLAAGALHLPLRRFVQITGICAALWVSMIFAVWRFTSGEHSGPRTSLRWALTIIILVVPWLLGKTFAYLRRESPAVKELAITTT